MEVALPFCPLWWWIRSELRFPRPLRDGSPHSPSNKGIEHHCNTQVPQMMWKQINMKWKSEIKVKINYCLKFKIFSFIFFFMEWESWAVDSSDVESWMGYFMYLGRVGLWLFLPSSFRSKLIRVWFSTHFCLDLGGNAEKSHILSHSGDRIKALLLPLGL